jgi:hypothetical protein
MRPALIVSSCVLALAGTVGLSACGGDSRPYDKVPTSSPPLVPPADANSLAGSGGTSTTGTTGTTGTDTTATPDTGANTGGATDTGAATPDTGGAATPNTGGTTTPNTGGAAPNTGGVSPDQNAGAGSFCQDNPGAC